MLLRNDELDIPRVLNPVIDKITESLLYATNYPKQYKRMIKKFKMRKFG